MHKEKFLLHPCQNNLKGKVAQYEYLSNMEQVGPARSQTLVQKLLFLSGEIQWDQKVWHRESKSKEEYYLAIKYLDVGPQAQLPPPYAEDISALLTLVSS